MAELSDSLTLGEFLVNKFDESTIQEPLGSSQLVRYTCVAASGKHVVFGANSGGVYCFQSNPLRYIRLLTNKEGPIRMVCFAPDGNQIAAVCGNELVVVWELNLEEQGISKRYYTSSILSGGVVQDICWEPKCSKVYAGDDKGRVAAIYLPKLSRKYDPFKHLDEVVYQDHGPVVQLDCHGESHLLVSLWTRCVMLTVGQRGVESTQVGKKLREGSYGACFFSALTSGKNKIYAARPGGRVWEAGLDGKVVATHKLKDMLSVSPSPILGCRVDPCLSTSLKGYSGPLNITALRTLGPSCVVVWVDAVLFVFSLTERKLIGWYKMGGKVTSVCCHGDSMYVVCGDGEGVYHLRYCPLEESLRELSSLGLSSQIVKLCAAHASQILLHFYNDRPMKSLITQAKDKVTPGQVTEEELSRVTSLLESEDWRIASSHYEVVQSSETHTEASIVYQQSFQTREEHPHIDSQLEEDVDWQMEAGLEAFPEEDSSDAILINDSGVEEGGNGNLDLKVEMELETSPPPEVATVHESAEELGDGDSHVPQQQPTREAASVDPVQLKTSEAVPVDIEEEEPEETRETTSSVQLKPDISSELEASMAELTTPLRSWSFKKTEKKGLEFSEFSPVRVVRSKPKGMQRKQQSASQTSSLANSPDTNTPVVTPGSLPSAQEIMSQEVVNSPGGSILSSSQEIASTEKLQEVPPAITSQEEAIGSKDTSQVELSGSQEVISSSQEVISSSQEVISSSQEVISSSQEGGPTSLEMTTSSGISSLPPSAVESSEGSPQVAPVRTQFKKPSTITVPPHVEEKKEQQQQSQEISTEEGVDPVERPVHTAVEAQVNDKGILLAEGQLEPGFDALGVQFSTLKQGGTALLSKVKNLAEKGKDRFTSSDLGSRMESKVKTLAEKGKDRFSSSDLGSRMEAKLEKPVTKMREILSTLSAPPTTHLEPIRSEPDDQVTGNGTLATITTLEGNFPTESQNVDGAEVVEETDSSGGKKAELEQLKEITAIVSESMSQLLLTANLSSALPLLYRWMDSLLRVYSSQRRRGRGREATDGGSLIVDGEGESPIAEEDDSAEFSATGMPSESQQFEVGHTDFGDVSSFELAGGMPIDQQAGPTPDEGVEEVDAPKGTQRRDATLLDAKIIHKWFRHTHFGSDLLANIRDLLLLFAQLADFSDQKNPFVKFFQLTSEDILPGVDVFVSLFAVEMDAALLLDHLTFERLDMRRKCWQAIVNSQQVCVSSDDAVLSAIRKDPARSVEQVQRAVENGLLYFPLYLHRLYEAHSTAAISLCYEMVAHVSPWIPTVLCLQPHPLDHSLHFVSTLETCKLLPLAEYIRELASKEKAVVQEFLPKDGEVLLLLTAAYLRLLAGDGEQCGGTPSPASHLSPWQQDTILRMLTHASLSIPMDQKKLFLQLFSSKGYWLGCLEVLSPMLKEERDACRLEAYVEAVEIVLRLEDIALLDTYG